MKKRSVLLLILTAYFFVGALFALNTPDWETPDEPAHYNYIRQLAAGDLPVMEPDDYDQAYLVELVFESHFDPAYSVEPVEYEDWQPPLYYLLQTPVYWLSGGSLLAMRFFSLLIGAFVVIAAFHATSLLFPRHDWLAATTAVFIAFLPQHLSILASVNNDSLAELIIAAILLVTIRWIQDERNWRSATMNRRQLLLLGGLMGLGFLTKGTVYPMALLLGLVLLRQYWGDWPGMVRVGLTLFVPALLIGALWWGRNLLVYGGLDLLGKETHDLVVTGQPRTAELVNAIGVTAAIQAFAQTTFNSFWGQFGWMTVPMSGEIYRLLKLFSAAATVGFAISLFDRQWLRRSRPTAPSAQLSLTALILSGMGLLTAAVHIIYNLTFQQHQGRYLFPALIPLAIGVAIGLGSWLRPIGKKYTLIYSLLPAGLAAFLIALDLWAIYRVIIPAFG